MTSLRYKLAQGVLRATKYRDNTLKDIKRGNARHSKPGRKYAARFEAAQFDDQTVWTCKPKSNPTGKVYVHIHGGAFVYGLLPTHYMSLCELADKSGAIVIVPDYPLPPTSAADMGDWSLRQYLSVVSQYGQENVSLGGCSAGANMALVVSQLLTKAGHAQPQNIQLWSAWLDLYTQSTLTPEQDNEALISAAVLIPARENYAKGRDFKDPLISPMFMDISDLPPIHILTGQQDILFNDIETFSERLKAAGKLASYRVEPEYGHYWMFYPIPDRHPTLQAMADILRA